MEIQDIGNRLSDKSNTLARNRGIPPMQFQSLLAREQLLAAVGASPTKGRWR